jgi:tRNA 2-selenouridine synthase
MTSDQKSSPSGSPAAPYSPVESLAGAHHPHAIEVQDFAYYALVIDVRPKHEYEADHIPGAVQMDPPEMHGSSAHSTADARTSRLTLSAHEELPAADLPQALADLEAGVKPDQAILIYCGHGGQVSHPLARALRWRGFSVDVLQGGWTNYRRWVQAGLELLPRLLRWRVISSSLGHETALVLQSLREQGQQVLDLEALACSRLGVMASPMGTQPAQAWFESQLLQAIRSLDPKPPVWLGDVDSSLGEVRLPGALLDALSIAPMVMLQAPLAERVRRWREHEPGLSGDAQDILQAIEASALHADPKLVTHWRQLAARGDTDELLASVLSEHLDPVHANQVAQRSVRRHSLPPLKVDSLDPLSVATAVRAWAASMQR